MDWSWAIDGITESMPRSTGSECSNFLTTRRKILECICVTGFCLWAMKWAYNHLQPIQLIPSPYQTHHHHHHYQLRNNKLSTKSTAAAAAAAAAATSSITTPLGKQILLIAMTFVFGMEIGFKLATKTVIFVFNPCHITTLIQIYLLTARPSKLTTALFRIQMNYLNGPFLAFLFPEVESRHLPLEQTTYWIQHGLMFIIPIYLLRLGGVYNMENIFDIKWNIIGYTTMIIYHFTILQFLSSISSVNLNFMLCAALSDPFEGPNYRLAAVIHQAILCPFLCKLFTLIFSNTNQIQLDVKIITKNNSINNSSDTATIYSDYSDNSAIYHHHQNLLGTNNVITATTSSSSSSSLLMAGGSGGISGVNSEIDGTSASTKSTTLLSSSSSSSSVIPPIAISRIEDPIMTTKID